MESFLRVFYDKNHFIYYDLKTFFVSQEPPIVRYMSNFQPWLAEKPRVGLASSLC
jgi:hypothetical protein